jgi:hypothetical protein
MRAFIVLVAVLTGFVQMSGRVLEACGAKFIVATKSPRFQLAHRTTRPATILLYQHTPDPDVAEVIVELRNVLNSVGHKVTVATSEAALREAAISQKFKVVMMQLDAARRLRSDLASWSQGAAILPMKEFVAGAEAARIKKEFGQMLKLPTTDREVLSVVRDAHR